MKKNLFLRTDVLPQEVPVLFTNKQVFMNFTQKFIQEFGFKDDLSKILTVPLFFEIPKSENEKRKIGLIHPIAQIQTFIYILKYDQLITSFCKKSNYSVRSPIKRNIPKYNWKDIIKKANIRIEEEFGFSNNDTITSDEDEIYYFNYFSYNKYKNCNDLFKSIKFKRDKYKYNNFMKLDIQRFFPSIYTHSLSWALFGDKSLAKNKIRVKKCFPNDSDTVVQKINFNETHGIVVGPEFSRIISELLLTRIDIDLNIKLNLKQLKHRKDYSIYRFIDDYFIFAKNKNILLIIEECLKNELIKYNLILNSSKTKYQEKPFVVNDEAILNLKSILLEFQLSKRKSLEIFNFNNSKNIKINQFNGRKEEWNLLMEKIEQLVIQFPNSRTRIINYFLISIRESIFFYGENKENVALELEVVSNIFKLDINNNSTNNLIAIYQKILNQAKKTNNQEYIEESIFQNIFYILKNNKNSLKYMFDIIVFSKYLSKKLPSSFLCELLNKYSDSYFICCSIGKYILDESNFKLNSQYKTVKKKLWNIIEDNLFNYKSKGATHKILESDYFYFLNDFSKYPGFENKQIEKLTKLLSKEKNNYLNSIKNEDYREQFKGIIKKMTLYSYYNWKENNKEFTKKVIKKSSAQKYSRKLDYI